MSKQDAHPAVEEVLDSEGVPEEEVRDEMAAEQDALMEEYLSNLQSVKRGEIRNATVVAIISDSILVNLDDKSEGIAPISEFRDSKGHISVSVGDKIPVLVMERDADTGQISVSHKVARDQAAVAQLADAQKTGTSMKGVVTKAVKSGVLVDCGAECFMPASHLDIRRVEDLESMVGQEVEFLVLEMNQSRGRTVVSRRALLEKQRDERLKEIFSRLKVGDVVEGTVKAVLGFGAFVDLDGVEAVIPREEVSWDKATSPGDYLRQGNKVQAKIVRLNSENGKISLSRKQMQTNPWEGVSQKYPKGSVISGEVTGLTKFGAFVRVEEGLTGLIHATDLSWSSTQQRPDEFLKEGDTVQAAVLDFDLERQRLSLGLKQISEDPWVDAEKSFPKNSKVKGVVTGLTKFGAFVRLAENIEGLIHQQDFTWDKTPPAPQDLLTVGQEVEAMVLKTDLSTRRISLGLKQLTPSPLQDFASRHRTGSAVDAKVISLIDSGAFMEIEPGVEGFMPVRDISEERIKQPSDVLKVGEEMRVKITKLDIKANRIALSRKAFLHDEERANVSNYLKSEDSSKGGTNLGELLQNITISRPK